MPRESIKQILLSTGDEVIARIVEEDDYDVFLRNALAIQFQNLDDGGRMYTFKLFMCYQADPERMIMCKMDKIVAVANPVPEMLDQYEAACHNIFYEGGDEYGHEGHGDIVDPYEELMKKMRDQDSASNNVIDFPKLH